MIYETLRGISGLDMPQRSFAHGTNLKLHAVHIGKGGAAEFGFPIARVLAEHYVTVGSVIVLPYKPRNRTLHRVTDVVHQKCVAIRPSVHVAERLRIAAEEGFSEGISSSLLGCAAEGLRESQKGARA